MHSYDLVLIPALNFSFVYAGAHNSYLQMLAELGFVGSLLFYATIIICVAPSIKYLFSKNKFENESHSILLFAGMLSMLILVFAMTENPFYQPQEFFLFATIPWMTRNARDNKESRPRLNE